MKPSKVKLVNGEVEGVVNSVVYEGLMRYFDENPDVAIDVIKNIIAASVALAVLRAFPTLLGRRAPAPHSAEERVTVS